MSETPVVAAPAVAPKPSDIASTAPHVEPAVVVEGEADLRDAGKKALDAMKAEVKAAKAEAKTASDERDRLKAAAEGKEAEWDADKKARETSDARFSEKYLKAEVKAAATGKLADPSDALRLLDMTKFEVSEDGDVDADAIASAIDALITQKPYLAAQGARFTGTPDAGARNATGVVQLTDADLNRMAAAGDDDGIAKAKAEGRLNDVLGIKTS